MKRFLAPALIVGSIVAPILGLATALGQAPPEQEDWEHLYRGSRLLVSKYSAWRVSEPILLEPKNVCFSVLSARNGQGILLTGSPPPDPMLGEAFDEFEEDRPLSFYAIDLKTGRVTRKIQLPNDPFTWLTPFHPGGRLFQGSKTIEPYVSDFAPPSEEFIYDARTGKVFRFGDRIHRNIVHSSHPDVVCYFRAGMAEGKPARSDLATYDLVDFRVLPPRHTIYKLKDSGDPSDVLDEDLCLLFECKNGVTGKQSYWKRQIETGWRTDITEAEFIEKRNRTGFNDKRSGLSLESTKPDESFLQLPWDGIRPRLLLEAGADYWDSVGTPPTFLAVHQGHARLYHVSEVDHKEATQELLVHAKRSAKAIASEAAKGLRRWYLGNQRMLPRTRDEFLQAMTGSIEKPLLSKFVWIGTCHDSKDPHPSRVEIAYLPGPTGRAAIFADLNVKWVAEDLSG